MLLLAILMVKLQYLHDQDGPTACVRSMRSCHFTPRGSDKAIVMCTSPGHPVQSNAIECNCNLPAGFSGLNVRRMLRAMQ